MISRELRIVTAAAFGLGLAFLSFKVLRAFIPSMAWALVLAVILAPVRRRLCRRGCSPFWASFITAGATLLLVLIPLSLVLAQLAHEIVDAYPQLMEQAKAFQTVQAEGGSDLQRWVQWGRDRLEQAGVQPAAVVSFFAGKFKDILGNIFQNTFKFLFHLFFTLMFLFAFLRYGAVIKGLLQPLLPLGAERRRVIEGKMEDFIVSLFIGVFLTAAIQGVLGAIGYALLGLPSILFLGTLTFLFSIIPMGGATLVWGPLVFLLFAQGRTAAGIVLIIYGTIVISGLDNILRPVLSAGRAKVNVLLILVGIMGGVAGLGMVGLLYGPIILYFAACVLEALRPPSAPPKAPLTEKG
jgi:predicted PurR-regulated permease PerM